MGERLGQHFLIHSWAARALAHAAKPRERETILEIGPGKGVLTKELLTLLPAMPAHAGQAGGQVIAVEKDEELVRTLHGTFGSELASGRLRIVPDDIRNVSPGSLGVTHYVVAANIPYYITGEIIRQFLTADPQPRAMALLIQKEVAQRIVSEKGSILSISVRAYGAPRIVKKVPKKHFSPPPAVDSAILAIEHISKEFFCDIDESRFFKVVKTGFASKRKFVANNLAMTFGKQEVNDALRNAGILEKARAEDLSIEQWKEVVRTLN